MERVTLLFVINIFCLLGLTAWVTYLEVDNKRAHDKISVLESNLITTQNNIDQIASAKAIGMEFIAAGANLASTECDGTTLNYSMCATGSIYAREVMVSASMQATNQVISPLLYSTSLIQSNGMLSFIDTTIHS